MTYLLFFFFLPKQRTVKKTITTTEIAQNTANGISITKFYSKNPIKREMTTNSFNNHIQQLIYHTS